MKVFVPGDSTALSVGADEVAEALVKAGADVIRTGSRGMFWLEPLVEVEINNKRFGFGPIMPENVKELFDQDFLNNKESKFSLGEVEEIEWFKNQTRITFQRVGKIDPLSLEDYEKNGGLVGLKKALNLASAEIVALDKRTTIISW